MVRLGPIWSDLFRLGQTCAFAQTLFQTLYHTLSNPFQALTSPLKPFQALSNTFIPFQPFLALPNPSKPFQAFPNPYKPFQAHFKPTLTSPSPYKPFQTLSSPSKPYQAHFCRELALTIMPEVRLMIGAEFWGLSRAIGQHDLGRQERPKRAPFPGSFCSQ